MNALSDEIAKLELCISLKYPPSLIIEAQPISSIINSVPSSLSKVEQFVNFYSLIETKRNLLDTYLIVEEAINIFHYFRPFTRPYEDMKFILSTKYNIQYTKDIHDTYSKKVQTIISDINNEGRINQWQSNINVMNNIIEAYHELVNIDPGNPLDIGDSQITIYNYLIDANIDTMYVRNILDTGFFDSCKTSKFVPFVYLIRKGDPERLTPDASDKRLYKIYGRYDYEQFMLKAEKVQEGAVAYVFSEEKFIDFPPKSTKFSRVLYDSSSRMLTITYSISRIEKEKMVARINKYISSIPTNISQSVTTLNAHFHMGYIENLNFDYLLYLIYSDPNLSRMCYFNESKASMVAKKVRKLNIVYGFTHLTATLTDVGVNKNVKLVNWKTGQIDKVNIKNPRYINVSVKKCKSEDEIVFAMEFIDYLLNLYLTKEKEIEDLHYEYIEDYNYDYSTKTIGAIRELQMEKAIERLKYLAPDYFINNASTLFSRKYPSVTEDEEEALELIRLGYQVIKIPALVSSNLPDVEVYQFDPDIKPMYFYSDDPSKPFLGLVRNPFYNNIKYPYFPVLFAKPRLRLGYQDEYDMRSIGSDEHPFQEEWWTMNITKKRKAEANTISRFAPNIVLKSGVLSEIPIQMQYLIGSDKYIMGLPSHKHSLIRAINYSLGNTEMSDEDVTNELDQILIAGYDGLFDYTKQETYDMDDSTIEQYIRDNGINTYRFIRLLEKYYEINLFIFITNEKNTTSLEVPRYLGYPLSYYKYNPKHNTVCLWRSKHTSDTFSYMPITTIDKEPTIFDTNLNMLANVQSKIASVKGRDITPPPIPSIPGFEIRYQHIDGGGKVYAFTITNGKEEVLIRSEKRLPLLLDENGDLYDISPIRKGANIQLDLPEGFSVMKYNPSEVDNFITLSKYSRYIKSICNILYAMSNMTIEEFSNIILIDKDVKYDFSNLNYVLPYSITMEQLMQNLEFITIGLIKGNNIILSSQDIKESTLHYCKTKGKDIPTIFITNYYEEPFDFTSYSNQQHIVSSIDEYNLLINSGPRNITSFLPHKEAYYLTINNVRYIVQYAGDSRNKAASILYRWYKEGKNQTYYGIDTPVPPTFDFSIVSPDSFVSSNKNNPTIIKIEEEYYAILHFDV